MSCHDSELAGDLVISHPSGATANNAVPAMTMPGAPPATSGYLCSCDGVLADQGAGIFFLGVFLLN